MHKCTGKGECQRIKDEEVLYRRPCRNSSSLNNNSPFCSASGTNRRPTNQDKQSHFSTEYRSIDKFLLTPKDKDQWIDCGLWRSADSLIYVSAGMWILKIFGLDINLCSKDDDMGFAVCVAANLFKWLQPSLHMLFIYLRCFTRRWYWWHEEILLFCHSCIRVLKLDSKIKSATASGNSFIGASKDF